MWHGITYPSILDHKFVQGLWGKVFCPRGWHLWDEVESDKDHDLFCDACEMEVALRDPTGYEGLNEESLTVGGNNDLMILGGTLVGISDAGVWHDDRG
jgi:hypothetical protein